MAARLALVGALLATSVVAVPAKATVTSAPTSSTSNAARLSSDAARLSSDAVVLSSDAALLSSLSTVSASTVTTAQAHGSAIPYSSFNPSPVTSTTTSSQRYAPSITWPFLTGGKFIDWSTYKANGANLGGWLAKEYNHDPIWWDEHAPGTADEWTFCETLGSKCGPVLEALRFVLEHFHHRPARQCWR
ncbi:hypothetical protein LTR08_009327 [Meristemomyces frigidus]|nr:hypothetical protein LTR08_009327 [Meristemomyces frigidus]